MEEIIEISKNEIENITKSTVAVIYLLQTINNNYANTKRIALIKNSNNCYSINKNEKYLIITSTKFFIIENGVITETKFN